MVYLNNQVFSTNTPYSLTTRILYKQKSKKLLPLQYNLLIFSYITIFTTETAKTTKYILDKKASTTDIPVSDISIVVFPVLPFLQVEEPKQI